MMNFFDQNSFLDWSWDGQRLCFVKGRDLNAPVIKLLNIQTSEMKTIGAFEGKIYGLSWLPDSETIVYSHEAVAGREQTAELWTIKTDSSELIKLTNNEDQDINPAASPDGKNILFVKYRNDNENQRGELYFIDRESQAESRFETGHFVEELNGAWSPDGSEVVFDTKNEDGLYNLAVADWEAGNVSMITLNSAMKCLPAWGRIKSYTTFTFYGFEFPVSDKPVNVGKNRVIPLKAEIWENNTLVTNRDIESPPVIQVTFVPKVHNSIDINEYSLPEGKATKGNQFEYVNGRWQYNLNTKDYEAIGSYIITMLSGDSSKYTISPSLSAIFVKRD